MSEPANKLNLTTQERRIVMGIIVVVIFVLNYLFVWPHFGELQKTREDLDKMYSTMSNWNQQINRDMDGTNSYRTQLIALEHQQGGAFHMDQQLQLQESIRKQAVRTGVNVNNYNPSGSHGASNEFFEEQSIQITFDSQEPQLIDFLYNIGNDPAMIRVAELSLRPADQNRYRLEGTVTLTASYTRRTVPGSASAPKKTPNLGGPAKHLPAAPGGLPPGRKPFPFPSPPGARPPNSRPGGPPGVGPGQRPFPTFPRLPPAQRSGT